MKTTLLIAIAALFLISCSGTGNTSSGAGEAASQFPATLPSGDRVSFGSLSFVVPGSWESQKPDSRMRVAQYGLPPAPGESEASECVLFHFPGMGGSVDANLQRWYGQFTQPDGASTADLAEVETFTAGGLNVTLVQVTGTYSNSMAMGDAGGPQPGFAMVAGVVETETGPWFLKCVGPEKSIEAAAPEVRGALTTAQSGLEG